MRNCSCAEQIIWKYRDKKTKKVLFNNVLGTVFLWIYWPSFNSVLVSQAADQQRTVINTYFSLVGSCVTTFAISGAVDKERKLDMVWGQLSKLGDTSPWVSFHRHGEIALRNKVHG